MNLDNYIKQLTKFRDENNAGNFQVVKWDYFERKDYYEGKTTPITKNDIEINEDEKIVVIKTEFHPL